MGLTVYGARRQWLSCLQIDIVSASLPSSFSASSASEVSKVLLTERIYVTNILIDQSWQVSSRPAEASLDICLSFLVMSNHHVMQEAGKPDEYLHFAKADRTDHGWQGGSTGKQVSDCWPLALKSSIRIVQVRKSMNGKKRCCLHR